MQIFRRAALRAASLQPARSIVIPQQRFTLLASSRATSQALCRSFHQARRSLAQSSDEQSTQESIEQQASEVVEKSVATPDVADGVQNQGGSGVIERAQEAVTNVAGAVRSAVRRGGVFGGDSEAKHTLYVGNLVWQTTAEELAEEFSRYGEIKNTRMVSDGRGVSKGFGYVEFATHEDAETAAREHNQRLFKGRRVMVQFHQPKERRFLDPNGAPRQPRGATDTPTSTLFIGNMSYQMSDRDLNDLFRDIQDVTDIRVAIDRRTGQPRGFAHADFVDPASAQRAKELLSGKVIYGRELRLDYTLSVPRNRAQASANQENESV